MIEILRELALIFKDLPESAVIVAGGILFYKLAIMGSFYGIARFLIQSLRDCIIDHKNKPEEVSVDGIVLSTSKGSFLSFLSSLKNLSSSPGNYFQYIHDSDLRRALELIEKGKLYEKEKENAPRTNASLQDNA